MKWENWREPRRCDQTNFPEMNWTKVTQRYTSSLHKYRSCKKERIIWMILESSKMQNRFVVENYLTFPVNRQAFQVLDLCWAATKACDLIHGICLGHRETCLEIHEQWSIHDRHLLKEFFTLWIKVLQVETPCRRVQGNLSPEVKNKIEILFQRWDLQGNCQPWILSFRQKDHRIIWLISKDCKSRSFISINSPFNVDMLEHKIQNPSKCLFRFSLGGYVMDQRSGDGRFGGWSKIIAINSRLCSFPEFWDAGRENCIFSEQDHLEFLLQERSVWRNRKLRKRSVSSRKTDRLHDLRLLSSHWCS